MAKKLPGMYIVRTFRLSIKEYYDRRPIERVERSEVGCPYAKAAQNSKPPRKKKFLKNSRIKPRQWTDCKPSRLCPQALLLLHLLIPWKGPP